MAYRLRRLRAAAQLAAAQLRYYRGRTSLAVVGVAIAVLLVTLFGGLGHGVTTRGMDALDQTNRDLWIGGNPQLAPGSVGGIENRLFDAHRVTEQVKAHAGVKNAQAISFQTVYVSRDGSEFVTLAGVGITGTSEPLPLHRGPGFQHRDVHYANGTFTGEWTGEVIVDEQTARMLGVSVGDSIHVGGTVVNAREHEFTVVGISSTFSSFVGLPTVVLHLSELQELTGTTASDPASVIAVTIADGANVTAVAANLQAAFPDYAVRTNREQFRATIARQGPVIASVAALVGLALLIGVVLVGVVLALFVQHQRLAFLTLRANGLSMRTLVVIVALQGIGIGLLGGLLAVGTAPFAAAGVNNVVSSLVGSSNLVRITPVILAVGFTLAIGMGIMGGSVAVWRLVRSNPCVRLHRE